MSEDIRETRMDGLMESVNFYLDTLEEKGSLSKEQWDDFDKVIGTLRCFGEQADIYCDCMVEIADKYRYILIGKKIVLDGETLFAPEYHSDGSNFGTIFKDEKAFCNDPNAVCYIPEVIFEDAEKVVINGVDFYYVDGYTRAELEAMITDDGRPVYQDEDGDKLDIEHFFHSLLWAMPETYLNEYECSEPEHLDCYAYHVETDSNGKKQIHIDGYCYWNDENYQCVQASGCYISVDELNGDGEKAYDAFDEAKQYQGDITEEEIREYYKDAVVLPFDQVTQNTPDGWYVN